MSSVCVLQLYINKYYSVLFNPVSSETNRSKQTWGISFYDNRSSNKSNESKLVESTSSSPPVETDNYIKCKPPSCCPHLFFNVSRRGGPTLWDGNLTHINTRLHLWGSEGKTLRPSYRGWKSDLWIKEWGCQCTHTRTLAGPCTHTEYLIWRAWGYHSVSYHVGCFWAHTYGGCKAAVERVGWSEVTRWRTERLGFLNNHNWSAAQHGVNGDICFSFYFIFPFFYIYIWRHLEIKRNNRIGFLSLIATIASNQC